MKTLIFRLTLLLFTTATFAQNSGQTITVTIDNVTNNEGKVLIALHSKDTFMSGEGVDTAKSAIKDGKITVSFKNVKPGEYAIIALHDANDNGRMDYQQNGMPLESYGTSNNPMFYGPPQYEEAKFKLAEKDIDLKIKF